MRQLLILLSIVILCLTATKSFSQNSSVDPTGTYLLDVKPIIIEKETYNYAGLIQVRKLPEQKILMTFTINKGAPTYLSGSFADTLNYLNNQAMYTYPEADSACKISFSFTASGIKAKETVNSKGKVYGFGKALVVDGFYKKVSSVEPVLRNPSTGEELK
jgi:hypothetical protein